eukprot:3845128-Amphidinium_carterae.1
MEWAKRSTIHFVCQGDVGCMGMDGAFTAASSPRVKGLCAAQQASKRPLKQARTLSTDQARALERAVWQAESIHDRLMAGHS